MACKLTYKGQRFDTKQQLLKHLQLEGVLDQLMKTNLAKWYEIMSSEEIRNKLIELGVDADVAFQISAWHGSPHKFYRFLTEFMGSGEGAQAFGWGLYFTDLESIAREYADKLRPNVLLIDGKTYDEVRYEIDNPVISWIETYVRDGLNKEQIILKLNNELKDKEWLSKNTWVEKNIKEVLDYINDKTIKEDKSNRNLYKVTLHKGKQPSEYTWLEWDKPLTSEQKELLFNSVSDSSLRGEIHNIKISDRFDADSFDGGLTYRVGDTTKMGQSDEFTNTVYNTLEEAEKEAIRLNFLESNISGKDLYEALAEEIGQKQASLFLLENGIDGVKYPAESISSGATSDNARGFNYVVFDENAVTIEEIIQFQKQGVTLLPNGFYHNGKVYINQDLADLSTPIHEFSHAYNQLLKNEKPMFYQEGLNLIEKEGQQYIDFVKKNQPNLQGEALLEEALAQVVGDAGAKLIQAEKSTGLKQWLQNAWNKIKEMLGLSSYTIEQVRNMSLQEYTNAVAIDLLRGEEVNFKTPSEEYFERNADRLPLTLAVFNRPEFKAMQGKMVNPITVLNSLNQSGIKQIEKDLIKQIIQDNYQGQKKISYDELEATVRANIMPLERIFTSSYANYGMDNLGDGNYGEANTIILNAPIEHGVTGHFSGDFKASGRKNIKYVPKQLNDNTWVAVEEGYESQANDNNIYQFVGTAGTKEAVDAWIEGYEKPYEEITPYTEGIRYTVDKFYDGDYFVKIRGIVEFDTGSLPSEIKTEEAAVKEAFKRLNGHGLNYRYKQDINKGMFGHIRVWQDGDVYYISELQSDFFQKYKAKEQLFKNVKQYSSTDDFTEQRRKFFTSLGLEVSKFKDALPSTIILKDKILDNNKELVKLDNLLDSVRNNRDYNEITNRVDKLTIENDNISDYINGKINAFDFTKKYTGKIKEVDSFLKNEKIREEQYNQNVFSKDEKQFIASQKEWEKRMVREAIKEASLSGATSLRFPTPYTLSVIEGYLSEGAPYEIENANDSTHLEAGDRIYYAGEDYTVVDSDSTTIIIAESGRLQSAEEQDIISQEVDNVVDNDMYEIENNLKDFYTQEEWNDFRDNYSPISSTELDEVGNEIEEGVFEVSEGKIRDIVSEYYNNIFTDAESIIRDIYGSDVWVDGNTVTWTDGTANIETLMQFSEYKGQGTKDSFSIEDDLDDTQQTVARKYEEIAEILKTERGDNFEVITDDNGFDWYETKLAREEINNPVTAFQINATEQELQQIKDEAIANGTFMKAPNGKDTNLNERQWLQVRSKNFRSWFGDFLNDPQNASKVVDDNGEPLIVLHGNRVRDLEEFNRSKNIAKPSGLKEYFDYFTTNRKLAEKYATKLLSPSYTEQLKKDIGAIRDKQLETRTNTEYYNYEQEIEALRRKTSPTIYEVFLNIRNPYEFNAEGLDSTNGFKKGVLNIGHKTVSGRANITEAVSGNRDDYNSPYDGIIVRDIADMESSFLNGYSDSEIKDRVKDYVGDVFATIAPNQIKSATDNVGTFSSETNDIRYQIGLEQQKIENKIKEFNHINNIGLKITVDQDKLKSVKEDIDSCSI